MKNENVNVEVVENEEAAADLMVINKADIAATDQLAALNDPTASFFCSIPNDGSRAAQIKIYNAINSKGDSLDDHKGEVLEIVDIAAHPVELVDENTGELVQGLRVVMVDKDGKNYDAVSRGIVSSLEKIFAIVGKPSYDPPLRLVVVEQKTRKGFKTNTLELV